jgi:hypothetical protein
MKRNATSKPSISPEQMAPPLAAAPERVDDPDCPYDPNDPAAVAEYWKDPITSQSLAELRGSIN